MDALAETTLLLAYDRWANARLLDALRAAPPRDDVRLWWGHILGAQRIWLSRAEGRGNAGIEVFPDWSYAEAAGYWHDVSAGWAALLDGVDEAALDAYLSYENTEGEPFQSRLVDIVRHICNHSTHHRGQICAALRRAGQEPPVLEYIVFTRKG